MSCIVYGLTDMDESQQSLFRKRYLDWIDNNPFAKNIQKNNTPKVLYRKFESEEKMLEHFFTVVVPKTPILAGWNAYRFDWQYLTNRVIKLFGKGYAYNIFRKSSPIGQIKKISWKEQDGTSYRVPAPCHSEIIDYMEIVKQYDYILRPYK